MGQLQRWASPLRLNCSETISHREKSEVGNETLDLGLQDIFMLFCYNLITFDSAAHLKWTNPTQKMELTHLWNETLDYFYFFSSCITSLAQCTGEGVDSSNENF